MRGFEGDDFRDDIGAGSPWERRNSDEMRRLLDRAVAASINGIIISDPTLPDDPIIYANPAFERTTGYSLKETVGRNCRFLQNDDRDQPELEDLRDALAEGREFRTVIRNYKKSGEMFWNELYISPVYDERGNLTNFIGVQHDITERKRAEEERDIFLARERVARAEASAARRRLGFLVEADAVLLSSVGYLERLRDTARIAATSLADWCIVDVLDENEDLVQVAAAHGDPEKQNVLDGLQRHRSFGDGASGAASRVLEGGASELIRTVSRDGIADITSNEESGEILSELGVCSLMSVPLLARGRTLGVVTMVSSDPDRLYGDEDLALAESFAYRCALAVDNARLYRERSHIARTLQRSLLPRMPEVEQVQVGVAYLPVGEESVIGGDFYDLIKTDSGKLVAVVGDVCGKGPAAAAVTALARYTIQAAVIRRDSPANALKTLNEAMLRQIDEVKFCTVACARLEEASVAEEFDLLVARGGHPPPLLLRAGGEVEKFCPPGRALGIFEDPGLEEWRVRLRPGDAAVLYTDGIIEARSPDGAFFGEEGLIGLLEDSVGLEAQEISDRLKEVATDFSEGSPRDDLAVLVLRVPEDPE